MSLGLILDYRIASFAAITPSSVAVMSRNEPEIFANGVRAPSNKTMSIILDTSFTHLENIGKNNK